MKKMTALLLSMLLCVVVLAGCATPKVVEDNRPTGDYDWDYIASLLRADEVTPEEVDDLARLYSAMTPKDMERFFAAGYIPYSPEGREVDITPPTSVLSPLMGQVCRQIAEQADTLALTLFDDGGVPHPGVTEQQVHEAQLQQLRAGILQDVCTYGQEVYYNGTYGYNAAYGPVSITQFGVNEELDDLYTYNVTLRHYEPYINSHDDMHQWASRGMGTGIITSLQASHIRREQVVGFLNELEKMLPVFRQSEYNKLRAREYETAHHITRGLEVLGASVRMGYNITTMKMEIRYITYDESEAYLRHQAYIAQLEPGADKPGFTEFVKVLQSGGIQNPPQESQLFDEVVAWYNGSTSRSQVEEQTKKYRVALEHAKVARPDIAWPENLRDCTREQMAKLIFYM